MVAVLGLLVTACQSPAGRPQERASPPAMVTITTGNLTFTSLAGTTPGGGSVVTRSAPAALVDRRPDLGIAVRVTGGRLVRVAAVNGSGRVVPGTLSGGATDWRADWALAPAQAYHVTATAVNP